MAVGYATLYGDMSGAFNPIKDLYKTEVYKIAEMRNKIRPSGCLGPEGEVIPKNIITKAPTAELRENGDWTKTHCPTTIFLMIFYLN